MGKLSRVFGINVTRDREKEIITHIEDVIEYFGMKGWCGTRAISEPAGREIAGREQEALPPNTGAVVYLGWISCCDIILFAVNQLTRALLTKPLKAHMAAVKNLLRYLAGSGSKRGRLKL